MDPVSLTLGILPLALTAIKGYAALHKHMTIFLSSDTEIRRLRKHLDRQQRLYRNEVQLLILVALKDDLMVENMMEDWEHAKWDCKVLETSLRSFLGNDCDTYLEVIQEISSTVQKLEKEMESFDQVNSHRQEGEPLRDTFRRLRSSLKITLDKSKFESSHTDLRNHNSDLRRLREQAKEIKESKEAVRHVRRQLNAESGRYGTIRGASNAVHCAFTDFWSNAPAGLRHSIKMFINAEDEDQLCMDMAVLCYGHEADALDDFSPRIEMLQVRSQTTKSRSRPQSDSEDSPKKRKRRHFDDDCTTSRHFEFPTQLPTPEGSQSRSTVSENLTGMNICSVLMEERPGIIPSSQLRYLGYIKTSTVKGYKHSVYHDMKMKEPTPPEGAPMSQMFGRSTIESGITVVDQLKLARSMVVAVLKFYSTPWLRQYFVMDDFRFFEGDTKLSSCLQTMHFSVDLISKGCTEISGSCMQGIDMPDTSESLVETFENAKYEYGIENVTLWCLGMILLQIGRWSELQSTGDHINVRKLSSQVPLLGPRYQQLTKRCLRCDFASGEDLSEPRLQQALHEKLVSELTEMIEGLSIREPVDGDS